MAGGQPATCSIGSSRRRSGDDTRRPTTYQNTHPRTAHTKRHRSRSRRIDRHLGRYSCPDETYETHPLLDSPMFLTQPFEPRAEYDAPGRNRPRRGSLDRSNDVCSLLVDKRRQSDTMKERDTVFEWPIPGFRPVAWLDETRSRASTPPALSTSRNATHRVTATGGEYVSLKRWSQRARNRGAL